MSGSVLVVGASSKLGRPVVRLLREQGRPVRAMTRTPSKVDSLREMGAEVIEGDLREPASLVRACEGVEAVVASAHGAGPDHPIDFFRIKHETEQALEASALAATSVRGSAFMETWLEVYGKMLAERGKLMIFGPGKNPVNFVSAEDVARVIVMALPRDETIGRIIDVGGPEDLSLRQVVGMLEAVTGRTIPRTHLPLPLLRVASPLVRPFHPGASRIIQAGILMNRPGPPFDGSESEGEFPFERSRFEDVARRRQADLGSDF